MTTPIAYRFESTLSASREEVWDWITSLRGIRAEMWPYFLMTAPRGARTLSDVRVEPGKRMFRSYVFLFGFLPIDYSDMTLLELEPGHGFVEQSPMGSMKLWRHERRILPCASAGGTPQKPGAEGGTVVLEDRLTFEPRMSRRLTAWFICRVFTHRHEVLRAHLGGVPRSPEAGKRGAANGSPS